MRHCMTFATALLMSATLGVAASQSQTATPPAQQNPQQQNQNQQQQNQEQKQQLPGSPEHQQNVDRALQSESGRAGKEEPLPQTQTGDAPLVNGAWNVPDAPKDSQTVPSKFSERNAAIDKQPIGEAPNQ